MLLLTVIYIAFIGFGNGPIFPNLLFLTPIAFGHERSTSIIGTQMAISSISSMAAPILCGFLGRQFVQSAHIRS